MPTTQIPNSRSTVYENGSFKPPITPQAVLDPEETNDPQAPPDGNCSPQRVRSTLETTFRHSGWLHPRNRIWEAMDCPEISENRRAAFAACGSSAWIVRHPDHPDRLAVRSCHCHDRFCIPCAREHGFLIASNVTKYAQYKRIRFITLTIRHSDLPLSDQIDKLIADFRKLRKSKLWTSRTTGGCSFLEVKLAEDNEHWHPHLHILQEGRYIPHQALSSEWRRITLTSFVVHIAEPKGRHEVVKYVTKYASKPLGMSLTLHADKLSEALLELCHRRMMTTFGVWRGFKLTEKPESIDWIVVAPLSDVLLKALQGEPWAITLALQLRGSNSCLKLLKITGLPP